MILLCPSRFVPAKLGGSDIRLSLRSSPIPKSSLQSSSSIYFTNSRIRFSFCCKSNEDHQPQFLESFSVLESDPPWESGRVWTTMALYFFSLHVPISLGGLSVVAQMLHQHELDSLTKAVAVLMLQILELFSALLLLQFSAKPHYKPVTFFKPSELQTTRNWLFASLLGFISIVVAIFFTSYLADRLVGTKGVNNQIVKEILLSGSVAQTACTLVYCIVAPLLEEIVYRGFLLKSLAPTMQWHQAVIVSSIIFSAAHLSAENFIQLFIVGAVLGCSYCWSGDLRSSVLLHSMYNALTLLITSTS